MASGDTISDINQERDLNEVDRNSSFPLQDLIDQRLLSARSKLDEAKTYCSAAEVYFRAFENVSDSLRESLLQAEIELSTAKEIIQEFYRRVTDIGFEQVQVTHGVKRNSTNPLLSTEIYRFSRDASSDVHDKRDFGQILSASNLKVEGSDLVSKTITECVNEPDISKVPNQSEEYQNQCTDVFNCCTSESTGSDTGFGSQPVLDKLEAALNCNSQPVCESIHGSSDADANDTEETEGIGHEECTNFSYAEEFAQRDVNKNTGYLKLYSTQNTKDSSIILERNSEGFKNYNNDYSSHNQTLDNKLFNSVCFNKHSSSDIEPASDSSSGDFSEISDMGFKWKSNKSTGDNTNDNTFIEMLEGNKREKGLKPTNKKKSKVSPQVDFKRYSSSDDSIAAVNYSKKNQNYAAFTADTLDSRTLEFTTDHNEETSSADDDFSGKSIRQAGKMNPVKKFPHKKGESEPRNATSLSDDDSYITISEATTSDTSVHDNMDDEIILINSSEWDDISTTSSSDECSHVPKVWKRSSDMSDASSCMDGSDDSYIRPFESYNDESESGSHQVESSLLRDFSGVSLNLNFPGPSHELPLVSFKEGVSWTSLGDGVPDGNPDSKRPFTYVTSTIDSGETKKDNIFKNDESTEKCFMSPYPIDCAESDAKINIYSKDMFVEKNADLKLSSGKRTTISSRGYVPSSSSPGTDLASESFVQVSSPYAQELSGIDIETNEILMELNADILNIASDNRSVLRSSVIGGYLPSNTCSETGLDSQSSLPTSAGNVTETSNYCNNLLINADVENLRHSSESHSSLSSLGIGGLVPSSSSLGFDLLN